jgi:PAS domain-containing protein
MTNINDLNKKLDDLFSEMELDPSPQKVVSKPVSWTWECNDQGNYKNVSPEVKEILGIDPEEFFAQPLSTFQLTSQSSRKLEVILGTLTEESQVTLQFRNHTGYSIPIRMHIFLSKVEGKSERVLHGRNQIVSRH